MKNGTNQQFAFKILFIIIKIIKITLQAPLFKIKGWHIFKNCNNPQPLSSQTIAMIKLYLTTLFDLTGHFGALSITNYKLFLKKKYWFNMYIIVYECSIRDFIKACTTGP